MQVLAKVDKKINKKMEVLKMGCRANVGVMKSRRKYVRIRAKDVGKKGGHYIKIGVRRKKGKRGGYTERIGGLRKYKKRK